MRVFPSIIQNKVHIIGQMRHEFSLLSAAARGQREVINSDIIVAGGVWLHSAIPLLGLCSISTSQVSNFDSLSTLISILESCVADIQFLWEGNKGCWCGWTGGFYCRQPAVVENEDCGSSGKCEI